MPRGAGRSSASATVGSTSIVCTCSSTRRPTVWPGSFMKSGMTPMPPSVTRVAMRRELPGTKDTPWSGRITSRARSQSPVAFIFLISRPINRSV